MSFTHLHLHTEWSLLDGVSKIKPLVKKVKELGMNTVSITDHGVMYGAYEFWQVCKENEVKPIIGCEVYVAARTRFDKDPVLDKERFHLTLLARTKEGYHNLVKLASAAQLEGMYYKPRIDRELMEKYGKGIIALTGCMSSNFNRYLAAGKRDDAIEWLQFMIKNFDQVYVELQRNGIAEGEALIPKQLEIAKEFNLPIVATCDVHYIEKQDYELQEIAWCIGDGTQLNDPRRRQYGSTEFYVKSTEEMTELFADLPEAIANTQILADSVESYSIEFDRVQPKYDPKMTDAETKQMLFDKTWAGARERYPEITPEIEQRINYELEVISDKGYNDYFLVVQDYINWARSQGIIVGPGRGSAAGSVAAYCMGITNLCPIKYKLSFERFLNPERPSPPDIDTDFQDDRRDELFAYMSQRYGVNNTSFIGTFGKLMTRAAIRDIGRVMGIDLITTDRLSKLVESKFGKVFSVDDMMSLGGEFKSVVDSDPRLQKLMEYVKKLAGIARHVSIHPCGYLVTPRPITDYVPVQQEAKGGAKIITQFEGDDMEPLGLMKFDFLGLANLTIIKNTLIQIKQRRGIDINIDEIPLDDPATFKLFQEAKTNAIFQFESDGMKRYLRELKATELEDIIFMAAAYRPGSMDYIHDYIERKYGRQEVTYVHSDVEEILKPTYGIIIYQEQIINIAVAFAGYSMGAADMLRRAMGKKKVELMVKERAKFVEKSVEKGQNKEKAEEVFGYMEPFANYGFNRSHSACYAIVAYQTAYLKANYPVEFLAGLMQSDLGSADKLHRDLDEARDMGVEIMPPSVNHSQFNFTIEGEKAIRFGLAGIKGASNKVMSSIVEEREKNGEYKSLDEMINRVGPANLAKKDLEILIKVGAMDDFGQRNSLLAIAPGIFDKEQKESSIRTTGQMGLFAALGSGEVEATPLPKLDPLPNAQLIAWEKEMLGVFLSQHPLIPHLGLLLNPKITPLSEIGNLRSGAKITVIGIVENHKVIRSKKNNKPLSFLTLSDMTGRTEGVLFNEIYEQFGPKIAEAKPIMIVGMLNLRGDELPSITVDQVIPIETQKFPEKIQVDLCDVNDPAELEKMKSAFSEDGPITVDIWFGPRYKAKYAQRKSKGDNLQGVLMMRKYLQKGKN